MVNCCEAGAAEPRGDLLAGWHAAKQARRSREGARGQGDKWARGRGSASGGGWQQEVGARRCRDRGGKGRGGRVADASLPARRCREVVAVSGWRLGAAGKQADAMSSHPYQRKEPGRSAGLWCMKLSVKLRSCNRPRRPGCCPWSSCWRTRRSARRRGSA